jgi:hypothetical protein
MNTEQTLRAKIAQLERELQKADNRIAELEDQLERQGTGANRVVSEDAAEFGKLFDLSPAQARTLAIIAGAGERGITRAALLNAFEAETGKDSSFASMNVYIYNIRRAIARYGGKIHVSRYGGDITFLNQAETVDRATRGETVPLEVRPSVARKPRVRQILSVVRDNPGICAADLGRKEGMSTDAAYSSVRHCTIQGWLYSVNEGYSKKRLYLTDAGRAILEDHK